MTHAISAEPRYRVGETVRYVDRQDRDQTGEVIRIEASWSSWARAPLVIYSLRHPTYANRVFHTIDEHIRGLA